MPELPMLPREPACPAALAIAGACASQQGVVCRIMERDQEEDPGLDMTAGDLGTLRDAEGGVYLNVKSDPSTVSGFCHGTGIPVLTDDDGQGRASYTFCPVWQTRRDRDLAGDEMLFDQPELERVSMGMEEPVATHEAPDPIRAGRKALDVLAPTQRTAAWR